MLSGVADPLSLQKPMDLSDKVHAVFEDIDAASVAGKVVDLQQDVSVVHERPVT